MTFANPGGVTDGNVLSGDGGLVKSGTGTLTLMGSNTFTGGASVSGGLLVLKNHAAVRAGSMLSIAANGSLVLGTPGSVEPLDLFSGDPQAGAPAGPLSSQPAGGGNATPEPRTLALLAAAAACGLALRAGPDAWALRPSGMKRSSDRTGHQARPATARTWARNSAGKSGDGLGFRSWVFGFPSLCSPLPAPRSPLPHPGTLFLPCGF